MHKHKFKNIRSYNNTQNKNDKIYHRHIVVKLLKRKDRENLKIRFERLMAFHQKIIARTAKLKNIFKNIF